MLDGPSDLQIRLTLVSPPAGIDYGVQRGRGSGYETLFVQQATRGDVTFDFAIGVASRRGRLDFVGPFVQGPSGRRFIYIDVGTYAGQKNTPWSRRMIVRLDEVTATQIYQVLRKPGSRLTARLPGTGKDGGPSCATVEPLEGWKVDG